MAGDGAATARWDDEGRAPESVRGEGGHSRIMVRCPDHGSQPFFTALTVVGIVRAATVMIAVMLGPQRTGT